MMEKQSKNKELRTWTYVVISYVLIGILITQAAPILLALSNLIQVLK
ncbi:Uncharacterised protein [Acinetobacter johnsonii]|jgi:hypothetical protein|nr:Uncharacterised protein [Acinetobacter johnsonii]